MTTMSDAGLKSSLEVENQPVIPTTAMTSRPDIWSWIWFILAVFIVLGFHIRLFGRPVPPAANFP